MLHDIDRIHNKYPTPPFQDGVRKLRHLTSRCHPRSAVVVGGFLVRHVAIAEVPLVPSPQQMLERSHHNADPNGCQQRDLYSYEEIGDYEAELYQIQFAQNIDDVGQLL